MNRLTFATLLAFAMTSGAQAAPQQVNFQATGIVVVAGPAAPVPQSTVTGSITFDAASSTSSINSLIGISMTIDGYNYSLGDLVFATSPTTQQIGGSASGAAPSSLGVGPDFMISWDKTGPFAGSFFYTTASGITVFSGPLTQFSISPIPEPASVLMMALGVAAIGAKKLRQRRSA